MQGLQYQDIVNAQGGSATNAQTGEITTAPMTSINPQPTNPSQGQPVVIQPAQTTGAAPLTLPQPANTITQADSTIAGAGQTSKTIQDYLNKLETPKTALDNTQQAYIDRLNQLYGSNVGKAQETANLEDTSGLNTLKKQLADLNGQILTKNAEYVKLRDTTEQNSNLKGSFSAKDTQLARAQAADVGLLQARAMGLQGQVGAAQDAIERAINLKYQGIEEEITAKEKQMALIAPLLTAQQAKQAKAQEMMLADEKERITEQKAKAKENLALIFQSGLQNRFVNRNGEFVRASDGKSYSDPAEFFRDAGVRSFEEAYQRGLVGDLSQDLLEDRNFVMNLRNTYPDAGILITDNADTAAQKIASSPTYQSKFASSEDAGFTLSPGQNRYDANGNLIASGGQAPDKPLTEAQAKDVTYAQRSDEANAYLMNLEGDISKYNPVGFAAQLKLEGNNITNGMASDQIKQMRQAERNFGTAILRRESGAAISPSEFATMEKQYFPRPGDDAQTLAQKAQNRTTAINAFKASNPNKNGSTSGSSLQWQDPSTGDTYQFNDEASLNQFKQDNGIPFNSAGNASASNKVKGWSGSVSKLPLLNPDGSEKPLNVVNKLTSITNGVKGGQCGRFVNQLTGLGLGDSYKSKMSKMNPKIKSPKPGMVFVMPYKDTGHTGFILSVKNGIATVKDSNYSLNQKVKTHQIPVSKMTGFTYA